MRKDAKKKRADSFLCPRCKEPGCRVYGTRYLTDGVHRYRLCPSCQYSFTTHQKHPTEEMREKPTEAFRC